MGKNSRCRAEPQRPSGSKAHPSPERQPASGPLVAVEAADAAAFAGQLEPVKGKSRLPFDSPNWIAVGYTHQSLCELPHYIGYPSLAAEDFEAKVRNGDVPAMRRCFLYDRNQTLPGPEYELLERPHCDEHKFLVQSDGHLEVMKGAFRSTARSIIYAPVRGYAYFVWKPAVAKHWPGVFASTPPSSALTNPIEGKQAPQRRRGPVTTHNWFGICGEIARRCIDPKSQQLRVPKSERKLAKHMLTWCQNTYEHEPAESEMREAVKAVCAALRRGGFK